MGRCEVSELPLIRPHPYQRRALAAVLKAWETNQSALLVCATGLGKTIMAALLLQARRDSGRGMMLAHRKELVSQAAQKIRLVTGVSPDVEMADLWADTEFSSWRSPYVVSSVQTQQSGRGGAGRKTRFNPHDFGTLFLDEAHRAVSPSWRAVADYYRQNPNLKICGLTATPNRADEKALGLVFQECAFEYHLPQAIDDGWLVPVKFAMTPIDGLDISDVGMSQGDLSGSQLGEKMSEDKPLLAHCDTIWQKTNGRKTLVFTPSVDHAERMCGIFNTDYASGSARVISGKTPPEQRREVLAAYARKEFPLLLNCAVFLEGFDDQGIEVVVPKPTKSTPLYLQMIGRATRTLPGVIDGREWDDDQKELGIEGEQECAALRRRLIAESAKPQCLILDIHCQHGSHNLINAIDALAGDYSDEVVTRAKMDSLDGNDMTPQERLEVAAQAIKRETEIRLEREAIKYKARFRTIDIDDPFNPLGVSIKRNNYWASKNPPTEKMIAMLERHGIDTKGLSKGEAGKIISSIMEKRDKIPATPKMQNVLRRAGFNPLMPMAMAKPIVDVLAKNGWRWPDDLPRPNKDGFTVVE